MGDGHGGCVLWKLWNLRVCLYLTICVRKFASAITTHILHGHMWPSQPFPQAINSQKRSWDDSLLFTRKHFQTRESLRIEKNPLVMTHSELHERAVCWRGLAKHLHSWWRVENFHPKMRVWSQGNAPTSNAVTTMILFSKDVCCLHLAVDTHTYHWPVPTLRVAKEREQGCLYYYFAYVHLHGPTGLCVQRSERDVREREVSPSIPLHPFPWDDLSHQTWG